MAHVGQERALRAIGGFGPGLGFSQLFRSVPHQIFEVLPVLAQFVLSQLAFRHIHRGADIFDELSVFIENRMADRMDVLDGSIAAARSGDHARNLMLRSRCFHQQFTRRS